MIAGLPGIGINGIFYLACAFLMPIIEIKNTLLRRSSKKRWKIVAVHFGYFWGMMGGFWLTGLMLGSIVQKYSKMFGLSTPSLHLQNANVFRMQPLFISLATLLTLVVSLRIFNYLHD